MDVADNEQQQDQDQDEAPKATKVYAPNTAFTGNVAGVDFIKGVGEFDPAANPAANGYFRSAGYGIGKRPKPPATDEVDARDWDEPHVIGTELRDAAVDPQPDDFLPPTNAGEADPHGPLVVAPGIHAVGPKPLRPGTVGTAEGSAAANPSTPDLTPEEAAKLAAADIDHQQLAETALAEAVLVDGQPAGIVAMDHDADPETGNMGPLGLSDPGSVEAGQIAAAAVAKAERGDMPTRGASQASWVEYAVSKGADRDEAQDMTRAQLIERYGA